MDKQEQQGICREIGALTLETRDRLAKAALFRLFRCDAMQPFMETFFAPAPSAAPKSPDTKKHGPL